ncbi:hypothetical protein PybrP1_002222 [[Pythium] brassicae (nom. inval.)]|nr:hypothetical protein PybrP1_002222 [[Pythium] brassicae (nom. inval.)]
MLCSHNAHVCDFASPPIRFHQQRQYRNRLAAPAPLAPVPMAFAAAPQHFCGLKHDGNKAALSFILSPSATERPKRKPTRASPKASSTVVASLSSDSSAIKKGSKFCV